MDLSHLSETELRALLEAAKLKGAKGYYERVRVEKELGLIENASEPTSDGSSINERSRKYYTIPFPVILFIIAISLVAAELSSEPDPLLHDNDLEYSKISVLEFKWRPVGKGANFWYIDGTDEKGNNLAIAADIDNSEAQALIATGEKNFLVGYQYHVLSPRWMHSELAFARIVRAGEIEVRAGLPRENEKYSRFSFSFAQYILLFAVLYMLFDLIKWVKNRLGLEGEKA